MTLQVDPAFLFSLVDLTTLSGTETDADLKALADQATFEGNQVAALCVYPQFMQSIRRFAPEHMPIAVVTNFPDGGRDKDAADAETLNAVSLGADEIDYVLPYRALMKGEASFVADALARQREACGKTKLKVIIESGVLQSSELIAQASELSLQAGADFIKTSTGKVAINATLETAEIMLKAIKNARKNAGFKAAGGIKTATDAQAYVDLAHNIMGPDWVKPSTFRIGASSLLADLKEQM